MQRVLVHLYYGTYITYTINIAELPSRKLPYPFGKSPCFAGKYIFKGYFFFHFHVIFRGCNESCLRCPWLQVSM